jgi:protein ImuB
VTDDRRRVRLACLFVPLFPLAARLRSEPELAGEAAAIFSGSGSAARLVAATRRARRAGLERGMTTSQARALLPDLIVRGTDATCERAAQQSLLEVAESCSPRVEETGPGEVLLDLTGSRTREVDPEAERETGHLLLGRAARAGLPARVGIAGSKLAARLAAELPDSPTVVPAGGEAAFLAPLPLARLSAEGDLVATLRRWGVRSIGDLARLPADEVASRLGTTGLALHLRARGCDERPLVPTPPSPVFVEGMELEWPLDRLEPFLFLARPALERLVARLEALGLACARLELDLALDPAGRWHRALRLPSPTRDARTLLTLLRLDLEARPPGAAFVGFALSAHPDRPREAQLALFGPAALSPDRLATTLARLFAALGPQRVGAPAANDGHRPEAFQLLDYAPPAPPPASTAPEAAPPSRGLLAVRVLRPPIPLEVLGEDRPRSVATAPTEAGRGRPAIAGPVRVASGPWRLAAEWWQDDALDRDYWDVELGRGGIYRIYRHRASGEWFADGVYD